MTLSESLLGAIGQIDNEGIDCTDLEIDQKLKNSMVEVTGALGSRNSKGRGLESFLAPTPKVTVSEPLLNTDRLSTDDVIYCSVYHHSSSFIVRLRGGASNDSSDEQGDNDESTSEKNLSKAQKRRLIRHMEIRIIRW